MASKNQEGPVTQEMIDSWKKKHGAVWAITIEDPLKELPAQTGYFRKPSRQEMGAAMSAGKKNDIRMAEVLLKNTLLGGDIDLENDDYFFGAVDKMEPILEAAQGTIKKL